VPRSIRFSLTRLDRDPGGAISFESGFSAIKKAAWLASKSSPGGFGFGERITGR
jgi:hypothetical protein